VQLLTEQLAKIPELNNSMLNVKVATVDGFQGSECDIVILSCVRSHSHGMRGTIEYDLNFLTCIVSNHILTFHFLRWPKEEHRWLSE
jgi:hypothetical protein